MTAPIASDWVLICDPLLKSVATPDSEAIVASKFTATSVAVGDAATVGDSDPDIPQSYGSGEIVSLIVTGVVPGPIG